MLLQSQGTWLLAVFGVAWEENFGDQTALDSHTALDHVIYCSNWDF